MLSLNPNKTIALTDNRNINWATNGFGVRRIPALIRCQANQRFGQRPHLILRKRCDYVHEWCNMLIITPTIHFCIEALLNFVMFNTKKFPDLIELQWGDSWE